MRRRTFLAVAGGAAAVAVAETTGVSADSKWRMTKAPVEVGEPSALAVGADGSVYVAGENVIAVLGADLKERGRFVVEGRAGCLAVRAGNELLVGMRRRVAVLKSNGAKAGEWEDLGERAWLTSIACDEENVYVADAGNRIVWRFDHSGKMLNRIGKDQVVPSPYFDVAINPIGELWVANPGKHGLENYRPNGDLVSSWYRPGIEPEAFCGCCNPSHIAFRADNSLVTVEKGVDRVKVYAPDWTLLSVVAGSANAAAETNTVTGCSAEAAITDLAVDGQGRILVVSRAEKVLLIHKQEG